MARTASTTAPPRKSRSRKAAGAEAAPSAIETTDVATPAGPAVLRIDTDMTVVNAAAQREQILVAVQAAPQGMALDLSAVDSIDSAGIQLLLAAHHSLQRHGAPLALRGMTPAVSDALGVYGLHPLLAPANGANA